jgi:putative transposase
MHLACPEKIHYHYFSLWKHGGRWESIHERLRDMIREQSGKKSPTAAIVDSQSVKTADHAGIRGYDAGKRILGRKRHLLVDTLGLMLLVVVHPADLQDRDGAKLVLGKLVENFG